MRWQLHTERIGYRKIEKTSCWPSVCPLIEGPRKMTLTGDQVVWWVLCAVMTWRFVMTEKFMPAGLGLSA